jgi:hypothetical protein
LASIGFGRRKKENGTRVKRARGEQKGDACEQVIFVKE